jgi:hypothetical protein
MTSYYAVIFHENEERENIIPPKASSQSEAYIFILMTYMILKIIL